MIRESDRGGLLWQAGVLKARFPKNLAAARQYDAKFRNNPVLSVAWARLSDPTPFVVDDYSKFVEKGR